LAQNGGYRSGQEESNRVVPLSSRTVLQSADFPRIAGQHADYLRKAMRDYKTGARKDPVMSGFANPLSAQEIENLAAYFSVQKGVQHKY
jgi:cytochrome c553